MPTYDDVRTNDRLESYWDPSISLHTARSVGLAGAGTPISAWDHFKFVDTDFYEAWSAAQKMLGTNRSQQARHAEPAIDYSTFVDVKYIDVEGRIAHRYFKVGGQSGDFAQPTATNVKTGASITAGEPVLRDGCIDLFNERHDPALKRWKHWDYATGADGQRATRVNAGVLLTFFAMYKSDLASTARRKECG
jgi:hypothetical protein